LYLPEEGREKSSRNSYLENLGIKGIIINMDFRACS